VNKCCFKNWDNQLGALCQIGNLEWACDTNCEAHRRDALSNASAECVKAREASDRLERCLLKLKEEIKEARAGK
jgi:hypothetical protein